MILSKVTLTDFRGYASVEADLGGSLTVLTGDNAQGKTNFLRAVELLGLGEAREYSGGPLVRFGAEEALVEGESEGEGVHERLAISVSKGRGGAKLALNGKRVQRPRWVGHLPVLFTGPEDRDQVTGPPSARRALLDELLEQCEPAYLRALKEYRRALRQRNHSLENPEATDAEVEIWEEPMAEHGGILVHHRLRVLSALSPRAGAWYRQLAGEAGELGLAYRGTVVAPDAASVPVCAGALRDAWAANRERDKAMGTTSVGPHRDEVDISLGGRALKGTGSSGEIWTAVLSLSLASAEYLGERLGHLPLLLLDDVLTWLDPARAARVLAVLSGMPQAILTTTRLPDGVPARTVYEVSGHTITHAGSGDSASGKGETWGKNPSPSARC